MKIQRLAMFAALVFLGLSDLAVAHPCSRDNSPEHKHCVVEGPQETYDIELMGRVFQIGPVGPTQENGALIPSPPQAITFNRPGGVAPCVSASTDPTDEAACAWDAVFAACENFFGDEPIGDIGPTPMLVSDFTVSGDSWEIRKPGGVRFIMSISFDKYGDSPPGPDGEYFSVSLQLYGDTLFPSPDSPWLPEPGSYIYYPIIFASITGRTARGIRPKKGCVSGGTAEATDFDPGQPRSLVITAPPAE